MRSTSKSRYVALRYVWGSVQYLRTTKSNLETLQRREALIEESLTLPFVIWDVLILVATLQEQYLWTYYFYIVQDEAEQNTGISAKWTSFTATLC